MADRWINRWDVPSESDPCKSYTVAQDKNGDYGCSCPVWKFRREECKHIQRVKEENPPPGVVGEQEEPVMVLANVREVTQKNGELLTPLIPIGHTHFQATLLYDLLRAGVRWKTLQARYDLAKRNSKKAITSYVEFHGRCIYGPWQQGHGFVGFEVVPVEVE